MEVQVSQLIPGCILTEDVRGKTSTPIIDKDTVLNEEHIVMLQKFLIDKVVVSKTLANGGQFRGMAITNERMNEQQVKSSISQKKSFRKYYENAIVEYKRQFGQWQSNFPVNILEIRRFLIPLIKSSLDIKNEIEIYKLYQHVTKKDYLYQHSISMAVLSSYLAKRMGFEEGESIQIGLAGFLSNIGMAKIDSNIIYKEGSLTREEEESMRTHPIHAYYLLQSIQMITENVNLAVLQHHERLDGSGYPLGLKGQKINRYARIIAVCDVYHAMTSDRFYQKGQSPFTVMKVLNENSLISLDPLVVEIFTKAFMNLAIGEGVKLSNTQVGKITFIDEGNLESPLVLLEETGEIISLAEKELSIIDFI